MKFTTAIYRAAESRGWLRVGIIEFSVGIILVLGLTVSYSSWAQECQTDLWNTDQYEQYPPDVANYPIRLNDVTLVNQITWAAQAFVAPERLEGLVPLYVYEADGTNVETLLQEIGNASESDNLHFGVAIYIWDEQRDQQEVWRARPYHSHADLGDLLTPEFGAGGGAVAANDDPDSLCIVLSRRLEDIPAVEKLWIPEVDWQIGLAQVR